MQEILIEFLAPYLSVLVGASYNIVQALEGLLDGSATASGFDQKAHAQYADLPPSITFEEVLLGLAWAAILLILSFLLGMYVVKRWKGVLIGVLLVLMPGILSICGMWPKSGFVPEVYRMGAPGAVGEIGGMLSLVVLCLTAGWTIGVLLTDMFSLQEKFRHLFDHIWYGMAVLTALFFVADTNASNNSRDLQESAKAFQQSSSYLLRQVKVYANLCAQGDAGRERSCAWSKDIQRKLRDLSEENVVVQRYFWKGSTQELYASHLGEDARNERLVREELDVYNNTLCPESNGGRPVLNEACEEVPTGLCSAISVGNYNYRAVVISNECTVPNLIRMEKILQKEIPRVAQDEKMKNLKWLFYAFFSFLAGNKVANATAKTTKHKPGLSGLGDQRVLIGMTVSAGKSAKLVWEKAVRRLKSLKK